MNIQLPIRGIFLVLLFSPHLLKSQIDGTKYINSDFFEVKPVISYNETEELEDRGFSSNFEADFSNGLEMFSKGEYDEAIDIFDGMAEFYPDIALPQYYLGLIYRAKGETDEAIYYLKETLIKDPFFLHAKYILGLIAIDQEENKTARTYFNELITIPDYAAYGYHGLGTLALELWQGNKAYSYFKQCLKADSSFTQVYITMAGIDFFYSRAKRGIELIEKGVRSNPDWEEGIFARALLSLQITNSADQFEKDINRLIELDPSNYHYYSIRGFIKMELGDFRDAVDDFRLAYNISTDSVRSGTHKLSSKLKIEEGIRRSFDYYYDHFDLEPEVRNYVDKGICLIMNEKPETALTYLDSANMIEPTAVSYTFQGSILRTRSDEYQKAKEIYTKAIELDSTHWMAYYYRGELFESLKKYDSAYTDFDKMVELKPRYKEGYKSRGIILMQFGYYMNAYKDFSKGISIDRTDLDLYFNRASIAMKLKQYNHVESDLMHIIQNEPDDHEAYYMLYQNRLIKEDTLQAIVFLDSASKFSRYDDNIHKELLKLATIRNQEAQCLAAHNRLVKYNPSNNEKLFERANYLYDKEMYQEALKDLKKLIRRDKKSAKGYYLIGMTKVKLGQREEGIKNMGKAGKLGFKGPYKE